MSISLEKVDQVKERTGVSYKLAKEALEHSDGDVVEAIIYLESSSEFKTCTDSGENQFSALGQDVSNFFKDIIHKGNVTRITIDKEEKRILDLPVTAGAIGAVFFAPMVVISIVAAFATGCEMSIHKEDGDVVNIKDVTLDKLDAVKDALNNCSDSQKDKPSEDEKADGETTAEVSETATEQFEQQEDNRTEGQ